MAHLSRLAGAQALLASDLSVHIYPQAFIIFTGTSAQLVAEGLIPPRTTWPVRHARLSFAVGAFVYDLHRIKPAGASGPASQWHNGDFWSLRRRFAPQFDLGYRHASMHEKITEIARLVLLGSPAGLVTEQRARKANADKPYQAFRQQVLSTTSLTITGAAA